LSKNDLNVTEHNRDSAGLRYVYPVVSRRAGGVSVGINLNTNNACNWRCIYCQVPDLKLGMAPPVDLTLLEQELRSAIAKGELLVYYQPKVDLAGRIVGAEALIRWRTPTRKARSFGTSA
jgi:hypothetical protein